MRSKLIAVSVVLVVVVSTGWRANRLAARDEKPTGSRAVRQNVELTVYAQDFAMVREIRPMRLSTGSNPLRVLDVSKQLDPHSVLLRWQGDDGKLPQLTAHSYDLGVADGEGLLKRYLGKEVELVRYADNGREADRQKGTLMVEANGAVVVQTDGKFYVRPQGTIVAPTNGDIVTIPQLTVQAESPTAQPANLEVAYLTRGLSWTADYVATLSPRDNTFKLECWATVTNRTGTDYPKAKVSLIAGTPNRAARPAAKRQRGWNYWADAHVPSAAPPGLPRAPLEAPNIEEERPEPVGDFHAYKIKTPTTVAMEQMNRLLMLSGTRVPIIKDYATHVPQLSAWDDYSEWGTARQPRRGNVQVSLTFFNREKDGLGVPLPGGSLRVYEPDRSNSLRYAGAATIRNTPKDEKVYVALARAFDVFTEWRIVKTQRINKRIVRKQAELILHNEKPAAIDLRVVQPFGSRSKVVAESHKHVNLDAYQSQWTVRVPAGEKVTLTYTVDLSG